MKTAQQLFNDAHDLLNRAAKANEDGNVEAYKALWEEYQTTNAEATEAQTREESLKAALAKYDTPASAERAEAEAKPEFSAQRPEDAKEGVLIHKEGGGYEVVSYASKDTEGWIKGYPPDCQHPDIVRRLTPELRAQADNRKSAFWKYIRWGNKALSGDEVKALQEGTDSEGGFLVPTDAVRLPTIIARGVPGGVTRGISSVFTTTRDSGNWPASTDDVTWAAVAEEASFAEANPTLSQVAFTIRKIGRIQLVAQELLEDSAVDVPALLGQLSGNGLGRYEDEQAIGGDGTTEPLGIRTTGAAQGNVADITDLFTLAAPTALEVINAFYELPTQWRTNATWHMSSSLMARLVAINPTGAGIHIAQELLISEPTPRLLGRPIVFFDGTGWDDAATIGANEEVGCIGDFSQYYFIDRVGMTVQRLDERYSDTDQVGFKFRKRYDSLFAENDAFRILKGAAS